MNTVDTIAAIAGGVGGAISIVRISGMEALTVAQRVWRGQRPFTGETPRTLQLGRVASGDQALFVYMPGPASYTGEDVVEIQGHGGNQAMRSTLQTVLEAGARLAEPGEFTFRAFVNGKMDLTQAEAVGDVIVARNAGALELAERQLEGRLGAAVRRIRAELVHELAELESRLDFPEENLDWGATEAVLERLNRMRQDTAQLAATEQSGRIWREGVRLVLAGHPNSGKSSLMNYLLGRDRAIVTEIAGTTRDTLEETVMLRHVPWVLTDTAGLREADNPVEVIGIARSKQALEQAEVVLWLLDATAEAETEAAGLRRWQPASGCRVIAVWNKIDRVPERELPGLPVPAVRISALTGAGMDDLLDAMERELWEQGTGAEPEVAVNARHAEQLRIALEAFDGAVAPLLEERWEVAAVFWHQAVTALGRITGETAEPDLLEDIFSRFCLGK